MLFQATWLVCFIALHIPTCQVEFHILGEDMEHQERIAVSIFPLFCHFAIHGGDEMRVSENGVDKLGEGVLEITEGEFFQDSGEGIIAGNFDFAF